MSEESKAETQSVSESEKKSLEMMCDAIVNKLLHAPMTELKKSREEPEGDALVATCRKLFALDQPLTQSVAPHAITVPAGAVPALITPKSSSGDRT